MRLTFVFLLGTLLLVNGSPLSRLISSAARQVDSVNVQSELNTKPLPAPIQSTTEESTNVPAVGSVTRSDPIDHVQKASTIDKPAIKAIETASVLAKPADDIDLKLKVDDAKDKEKEIIKEDDKAKLLPLRLQQQPIVASKPLPLPSFPSFPFLTPHASPRRVSIPVTFVRRESELLPITAARTHTQSGEDADAASIVEESSDRESERDGGEDAMNGMDAAADSDAEAYEGTADTDTDADGETALDTDTDELGLDFDTTDFDSEGMTLNDEDEDPSDGRGGFFGDDDGRPSRDGDRDRREHRGRRGRRDHRDRRRRDRDRRDSRRDRF